MPSPKPRQIFEIRPIRWLLEHGVVVICAGGGGVPTMFLPSAKHTLVGVEAVIDKDFASELLARDVAAEVFVMATDVEAVYADWGTPQQRPLGRITVAEMRQLSFPAGSMGPKVEAACQFVEATGGRARSAPSRRSSRSSTAAQAPKWSPHEPTAVWNGGDDDVRRSFGGGSAPEGHGP